MYYRRVVKDYETIMTKDLYDNLQDGIDEAKESIGDWDSSKGSIMAQIKNVNKQIGKVKLTYNADTKYLVMGKSEEEPEETENTNNTGGNVELDTDNIITPEEAKAIFDNAEKASKS